MIRLHRLTHPDQAFFLNADRIMTVEATPDTVVTLDDASKLVVIETPEEIVAEVRDWRASVGARATSLERGTLHAVQ